MSAPIGPGTTNAALARVMGTIEPGQNAKRGRVCYMLTPRQQDALEEARQRIEEAPDED